MGWPRDTVLASDEDISVPVDIGDAIIELDVEASLSFFAGFGTTVASEGLLSTPLVRPSIALASWGGFSELVKRWKQNYDVLG